MPKPVKLNAVYFSPGLLQHNVAFQMKSFRSLKMDRNPRHGGLGKMDRKPRHGGLGKMNHKPRPLGSHTPTPGCSSGLVGI